MTLSGSARIRTATIVAGVFVLVLGAALRAGAQETERYDRSKLDAWLAQYSNARPDFKPGDVLTAKDIGKLRPFVPPGLLEKMMFPEFQAPIIERRSHRPRADFMACTEKYQAQSRLDADGTLTNNVCGQPFADSVL